MQYVLTGFSNEVEFRVFAFDVVGDGRIRTEYWVRADLRLVRKYGIKLQELPLLCREILEQRIFGSHHQRTFIYTEAEMCIHADARTVAAEKLKASTKATELQRGYMIHGSRSGLEGQMSKTTLIATAVVFVILGAVWYFLIR